MVSPVHPGRALIDVVCASVLAAVLCCGCAGPPAEVELVAGGPPAGPPPTGRPAPRPTAEVAAPPALPTIEPVSVVPPPTGPAVAPLGPPPTAPAPPSPEEFPVPPLPPEYEVVGPSLAPPAEAAQEKPTSLLWVKVDEYGSLAQTDKEFVLFYPLRYHGGFTATTRSTDIQKVADLTVAPIDPEKLELIKQLDNVLGVNATHYSSLNLLIIKVPLVGEGGGTGTQLVGQVKELLDLLDAPRKQVAIEAKIVEIAREDEIQLGVDWSVTHAEGDVRSVTGNFNIPGSLRFGTNDFNVAFDTGLDSHLRLEATLRALEAMAKLEVISEPSMVVEVGQTARVLVGQEIPIQSEWKGRAGSQSITTKLKDTGVRLWVTPLTVSDDTIRLQVWVEVSDVQEFLVTGEGIQNPVINTRNAQTTVSVRDGEIIKIAGLLTKDEVKTEVKVPLLGDIPFVGFVFKSWRYDTVERDLLIFITPRIIRGPLIEPDASSLFVGALP